MNLFKGITREVNLWYPTDGPALRKIRKDVTRAQFRKAKRLLRKQRIAELKSKTKEEKGIELADRLAGRQTGPGKKDSGTSTAA